MSTISINQPQHSNITQGHPNTSSKIISAYIRLNNKKAYLIKLNSKINLEQLYKIISYHLKVETKDIVVITKGKILHQKILANNYLKNQSNFIKNQPKSQIYQAQTFQVLQEKDNAVSNDINHPTNKSQAFMQQIRESNKSNIINLNKIQIIVDEKQIFHAILYPNILNFKFLRLKIKQMIKVLSNSSAGNQQSQEKLSHKNSSSNILMMANDQIYGLLDKNNSLATTGDFQKLIKNNSNMSQEQVKASQTSGRTSVNRLGAKSFTYTYILDNIDKTITIKQLIISKFNQVQIPLISNPVIQSFIQKVAPGTQTDHQSNQQSSLPPFISFSKLNEILNNSAVIVYTGRILSAYKTLEQEFVQNDAQVIVTFRKALKMQKLREQFSQKSKIVEQNTHSQQNHQVEGYAQLQSFKSDCIVIKQYQTQEPQKQLQHHFEQQKQQQQHQYENVPITKQQNPKPDITEPAQTEDNNHNNPAVQEHQKQQQNDQANEGMLSPIYPGKHNLQQIYNEQTNQQKTVHEQQQQQQYNQSQQQQYNQSPQQHQTTNNYKSQLTQTIHPQTHHRHPRPYKMSVDSQQLIQLLSLNPNHTKDINKLQKQQQELNNLLYLQPLQQKLNSQNYDQEYQQQQNDDNNKKKQQNQGKEQCVHYQHYQQKQVKQQDTIHKQAEEFAQQLLTLQFEHLKHEIKVEQQMKQKQAEQHKKGQQQNIVQFNQANMENIDVNQLKSNQIQKKLQQFKQNNQQSHQQQQKQLQVHKQNNQQQQNNLIENQEQQQQIVQNQQHDNIIIDQNNHIQFNNHNNTNNLQLQPQKLQSSNYNNQFNKQNLSNQQVQQAQQQVQKLQNSYQNNNPNNNTTNNNIDNDLSINYKPPEMIQNYYNSNDNNNDKSAIQQEILEEQQTIRQVDNSQYKQLKENKQQQQQLLILQQTKLQQQQQHKTNQQDQQLIQNLQQQHQINHQPSQQQLQQPQQNNYQFKSLIKTKQQQKVSYLVLQSYQPKPKLNKVNIIDGLIGELIFIDYDQQRQVETDDPVKGRYLDEKEGQDKQLFQQGNKQELQEKTPSLKTQNSLIERVQGIPSVIKNQLASVSPIQGNTELTQQNNFENVNLTQNNQLKNNSQTHVNNLLIASTASPIQHMMISSIQLQNDKQYKQELSKRQINNYLESYNGNLLEISPLRDSLGPGSSILKEADQIVEIQRIQKAESKQYDLANQRINHEIEKSQDKQNQEIEQQQVQEQDFNEVEDENEYQGEEGQQEGEQEAFSQQISQQEQVQPKVKFTQGDLLYTVELQITPKPKLIDAIAYDYHDLLCKNLEQFVQIFGNIIPQDTQNTNMQPFGQHQKRFSFIIQ